MRAGARARAMGRPVGGVAWYRGLLVVVLVLVFVGVMASSVFAAGGCVSCRAWWHLTSNARPTNLHAGAASGSVSELLVTTEEFGTTPDQGGMNVMVNGQSVGEFLTEPLAGEIGVPFQPATAANIQAALEAVIGSGAVTVVDESSPAQMKFRVSTIDAHHIGAKLTLNAVLGTKPEVRQVIEGKPDGTIVVVAADLGDASVGGGSISRSKSRTGCLWGSRRRASKLCTGMGSTRRLPR